MRFENINNKIRPATDKFRQYVIGVTWLSFLFVPAFLHYEINKKKTI